MTSKLTEEQKQRHLQLRQQNCWSLASQCVLLEEANKKLEDMLIEMTGHPDPEAFMAAHDKLVEACEGMTDFCGDDGDWYEVDKWIMPGFDEPRKVLREALAAVKEASDVKATKVSG